MKTAKAVKTVRVSKASKPIEISETYASVWDAIADTPEQAANLKARAALMRQIEDIVREGGWTQAEAARRCGVTQPRMNDLLRGRVSRFSLDALVNIATAIGREVHVELRAA
jgi:predicted XRE-type DNA-binding protein